MPPPTNNHQGSIGVRVASMPQNAATAGVMTPIVSTAAATVFSSVAKSFARSFKTSLSRLIEARASDGSTDMPSDRARSSATSRTITLMCSLLDVLTPGPSAARRYVRGSEGLVRPNLGTHELTRVARAGRAEPHAKEDGPWVQGHLNIKSSPKPGPGMDRGPMGA